MVKLENIFVFGKLFFEKTDSNVWCNIFHHRVCLFIFTYSYINYIHITIKWVKNCFRIRCRSWARSRGNILSISDLQKSKFEINGKICRQKIWNTCSHILPLHSDNPLGECSKMGNFRERRFGKVIQI